MVPDWRGPIRSRPSVIGGRPSAVAVLRRPRYCVPSGASRGRQGSFLRQHSPGVAFHVETRFRRRQPAGPVPPAAAGCCPAGRPGAGCLQPPALLEGQCLDHHERGCRTGCCPDRPGPGQQPGSDRHDDDELRADQGSPGTGSGAHRGSAGRLQDAGRQPARRCRGGAEVRQQGIHAARRPRRLGLALCHVRRPVAASPGFLVAQQAQ